MPSNASSHFDYNMVDVTRLLKSHTDLGGDKAGKKALGHITRSGVVMLCACWEQYIEHVLIESVDYLINECPLPDNLPLPVQKQISKYVRDSKHELRPLHLSGDGWKSVYKDHVVDIANKLNTPKAININELFLHFVGIELLSDAWEIGATALDGFVSVRGDIAHKGRYADYITYAALDEYCDQINSVVVDTDNFVAKYLKENTPNGKKPWNVTRD